MSSGVKGSFLITRKTRYTVLNMNTSRITVDSVGQITLKVSHAVLMGVDLINAS